MPIDIVETAERLRMIKFKDMIIRVKEQLAVDMNCAPGDFDGTGFVFTEAAENLGRRPFPRGSSHFEMATMGGSIVVSASSNLMKFAREQLDGRERDEAFSLPFLCGHSLYYLPDPDFLKPLPVPEGFETEVIERADIRGLYALEGFHNAIQYDVNHPRPDVLAVLVRHSGEVAAIAGASADCVRMWQIGIDVKPQYRHKGLAAAIVGRLAANILERGYIPYYGTASSNIPSQSVAHRAGFQIAWMCVYKVRIPDTLPSS